jgi:hypothetical protein
MPAPLESMSDAGRGPHADRVRGRTAASAPRAGGEGVADSEEHEQQRAASITYSALNARRAAPARRGSRIVRTRTR